MEVQTIPIPGQANRMSMVWLQASWVKFIFLLIVAFLHLFSSSLSQADGYVRAGYGIHQFSSQEEDEFSYDSPQQEIYYGAASFGKTFWRSKWFPSWPEVKGRYYQDNQFLPKQLALSFTDVQAHQSIYRINRNESLEVGLNYIDQSNNLTLNQSITYLSNSGSSQTLTNGSTVLSVTKKTEYLFGWRLRNRKDTPLTLGGGFYQIMTQPLKAKFSTNPTAQLYDGEVTTLGLYFGRMTELQGLNKNYQFKFGKGTLLPSNDQTQSSNQFKRDTENLFIGIEGQLFYRSKLRPYWDWFFQADYQFQGWVQLSPTDQGFDSGFIRNHKISAVIGINWRM